MPTRELPNQRLGGMDIQDSNDLQGTMIWFFINTNLSDGD